jgi:hypothetical protein
MLIYHNSYAQSKKEILPALGLKKVLKVLVKT